MRKLCFKVDGQMLEAVGDHTGLVPGTEGYLLAGFEFSDEWSRCVKAASFFDRKGEEYPEPIINNQCIIPKEVLVDKLFKVQVIGVSQGLRIPTNTIKVKQKG